MVQPIRTPRTIGTTHGTPSRVPMEARLVLQMLTTTTATTATGPILTRVRLPGAPTSPLPRRRGSLIHIRTPTPAPNAPPATQELAGSLPPPPRHYITS